MAHGTVQRQALVEQCVYLTTVLRAAFATEADAARRLTLARNMERWRWLPRDLGAADDGGGLVWPARE